MVTAPECGFKDQNLCLISFCSSCVASRKGLTSSLLKGVRKVKCDSTAEPILVNLNPVNLGIKLSRAWILDGSL